MSTQHILLVEDDQALASSLAKVLEEEGYAVQIASAGDAGLRWAREQEFDLVLSDIRLPGMGGLELVQRLHELNPRLPVILVTAHGTADIAIEATKRGAHDFLLKPFAMPDLLASVARVLEETRHHRGHVRLPPSTDDRTLLVGRSRAMQDVYKEIGRVAPLNVTVLVRGETGTGKEMVARAIWRHSGREGRPFLAINCASIPETLLESELFGHERGAFTGAVTTRIGRFEQAAGGTLFLDEIGDISPATQVRLLRVLQERTIQRVGGRDSVSVDVRIIAATHRDIESMIADGRFREDLYYRLNGVQIRVPPLRERPEDVALLAKHFSVAQADQLGFAAAAAVEIRPEALARLERHTWPGNVRELENVVRRALLASRGFAITAAMVEAALGPEIPRQHHGSLTIAGVAGAALTAAAARGEGEALAEATLLLEAELLRQAMLLASGNQSRVARWLGISRLTLREKLQRHGLHHPTPGASG